MTGKMQNFDGIPLFVPNDITNSKNDFYISYNSHTRDYGSDTTALVLTSKEFMDKFLILNGNHKKQYDEIINNGGNYNDCLEYFKNNIDLKNKLSENWDEVMTFTEEKGLHTIKDPRYL